MNIQLLVATHKSYRMPDSNIYLPIHVGAEGKENINYQRDNIGENISYKNKNYCELTALYWAWKNLDCDFIGLSHYRRFFNFNDILSKIPNKNIISIDNYDAYINKVNISDKINELFSHEVDIIVPRKRIYPLSLKQQYQVMHRKEDWDTLIEVILEKYPEYNHSIKEIFYLNNKAYLYNMFISKKEFFNKYQEWLYDILFEVEQRLNISDDPYQARVYGFMSERLFNLYIYHNNVQVKELPILFLEEKNSRKSERNLYYREKVIDSLSDIFFKIQRYIILRGRYGKS